MIKDDTWQQTLMNEVCISPDPTQKAVIELTGQGIIKQRLDAVFPILHGQNGEDGTVQGLIQLAQIPLIGCNLLSSALCMDKNKAHMLVEKAGIRVPQAIVLRSIHEKKNIHLEFPLFVKPMKAGSSYGISKVENEKELEKAIAYAFEFDDEVIVEEEIQGFEVGCAIIGNTELIVGRVDEIELSGGFFDFEEKYTLKTSQIHMPARIDQEIEKRIQETAQCIYRILGCSVFARVDMFLTPQLDIVFNEVNTIPGFTSHSRFPQMMKGIGYSFENVVTSIIEMGINYENSMFK